MSNLKDNKITDQDIIEKCDHRLYMPVNKEIKNSEGKNISGLWWSANYRDQAMCRLKAYFTIIDQFKLEKPGISFCCYLTNHKNDFYLLCDKFRADYVDTDKETLSLAFTKTLNNLKSTQSGYRPRNERGVYSE